VVTNPTRAQPPGRAKVHCAQLPEEVHSPSQPGPRSSSVMGGVKRRRRPKQIKKAAADRKVGGEDVPSRLTRSSSKMPAPELVQTSDPSPLKRRRKDAKAPPTGPPKMAGTKHVPASQSHSGSKKREAPANTRHQAPVGPIIPETPASTPDAQVMPTQGLGSTVPILPDTTLLQVTNPEEIAERREILEVPDGHKLIHLLRHTTSWCKYILLICLKLTSG
jgi:hypothetical protein